MAVRTRADMEAQIEAGNPVLFNGKIYTTVESLPTQEQIDLVYTTTYIPGPKGDKGDKGDTGDTGPQGAGGVVNSVNGQSAVDVTLDADDIDDSATTKKFTNTAEKASWSGKAETADITAAVAGKANTADVNTALAAKADANALDASNLTSGTIPDARFPAVLPAVSAANLTDLPSGGGAPLDVQTFTSSGTWTKPEGVNFVRVICIGAGGGGASGRATVNVNSTGYGTPSGAGGAIVAEIFYASNITSTVAVTVGTGGTGGAAVTRSSSGNTAGNAGGNGGSSSFGAYLTAGGGTGANPSVGGPYAGGTIPTGYNTTFYTAILVPFGQAGADGPTSSSTPAKAGHSRLVAGPSGGNGGEGNSITVGTANGGAGGGTKVDGTNTGGGGAGGTSGSIHGANGIQDGYNGVGSGGGGGYAVVGASGTSGNGGHGSIGAGGGGGGMRGHTSGTMTSGAGGNGGNGLVVVYSW